MSKILRKKKNSLQTSKILLLVYLILVVFTSFNVEGSDSKGLVGYWDFDEESGSVAIDQSGNSNNGIIYGAIRCDGQVNGALSFDGINDYVEVPHDASLAGMAEFTVEARVYFNTVEPMWQGIVVKRNYHTPSNVTYQLSINRGWNLVDPYPALTVGNDAEYRGIEPHENIVAAGKWYRFTGVYTGEAIKLYIDGQLCVEQEFVGGNLDSEPQRLLMGTFAYWNSQNYYLNGKIDEVKIYNYALPAEQIAEEAQLNLNNERNEIEGEITSDTIWKKDNGPYIIVGNVQVRQGIMLTIEPGVEVLYSGPYEILVKGRIIVNGTPEEKIIFTSTNPSESSNATMIKFDGTELANSQFSHVEMKNAAYAICANYGTGVLNVSNIKVVDAAVISYSAEISIDKSEFDSAEINGKCWGNGKIEISNSSISSSYLIAGNRHNGITVNKSTITNSLFDIRNTADIIDSYLQDCNIKTETNVVEEGQIVTVSNSRLINSPIDLPEANLIISNSKINYSGANGIICRRGNISDSSITGNGAGVGICASGKTLYLKNSIIKQNEVGIKLIGYGELQAGNCDIYENTIFNIENRSIQRSYVSNNYWGTINPSEVSAKIYDYYDNKNYGIVKYSSYDNYSNVDMGINADLIPQISIEIEPKEIKSGQPITINIIGADDIRLSQIWWMGENSDKAVFEEKHIYACTGLTVSENYSIDTEELIPGTYIIKAGAIDSEGKEIIKTASFSVINPIVYVEPLLICETENNVVPMLDTVFYRVYWNRGYGAIDYVNPIAVIDDSKINWAENTPVLEENKIYQFTVKAVDVNGYETKVQNPVSIVKIDSKKENFISSVDGSIEVIVPADAVIENQLYGFGGYVIGNEQEQKGKIVEPEEVILEIIEEPLDLAPVPENLRPIDEYRNLELTIEGKETKLNEEITIHISYSDNNQDGFVDGTRIPETELVILWFNPQNQEWERDFLTYVDIYKNTCSVSTKRQGKFAIFSPVGFVPFPVENLYGKVSDSRAILEWKHSISANWDAYNVYIKDTKYYEKDYKIHYNIYFDKGTGVIDYSKPIAQLNRLHASWISPSLSPGFYHFGIRVEDLEGNEEKNKDFIEIEIVAPTGTAKANITVPQDGKRIRGNAVTVKAETSDDTRAVKFQYKKYEEDTKWIDITSLDKKKPYSVYWNVSGLENSEYLLRAIAYDSNWNPDNDPATSSVIIDDVNWDIHEDGNPDVDPNNEHRKSEKIKADKDSEVIIADGTGASIPAGVISDDEAILDITILDSEKMKKQHPQPKPSIKPAGVYRKFEFQNGDHLFNDEITLSIPYPDEDDDGIVDGTEINEEDLSMFYLDEEDEEWVEVPKSKKNKKIKEASADSYDNEKNITAKVDHFTIFALMANAPAEDLSDSIVYPNPFKPNSGLGHEKIIFDGLTENVNIRIYTIGGRLVKEWEGDTASNYLWEWDVKNNDSEDVVSGVYIYVITTDSNKKAIGKIAVIR